MPKQSIIPAGTPTPIAPFVPATRADNIVYVSGTLPFDAVSYTHLRSPRDRQKYRMPSSA